MGSKSKKFKLFKENERLSVPKFAKMISGDMRRATEAKYFNLLNGRDSYFTIEQIKKMCDVCGMTFEETFKLREM